MDRSPRILCIESATKNCSIAFFTEKASFVREQSAEKYIHAETLHTFIDEVVKEAGETPDAIAVSKGPGSYTGLRIGVAAAKGLCFGWNIPLIGISTLDHMAYQTIQKHPDYDFYLPMIDARRMEVFTRAYNHDGEPQGEIEAVELDANSFSNLGGRTLCFGDGAGKCEGLLPEAQFAIEGEYLPTATAMKEIAEGRFQREKFDDTAYFEPFYLKDFIAGKAKPLL